MLTVYFVNYLPSKLPGWLGGQGGNAIAAPRRRRGIADYMFEIRIWKTVLGLGEAVLATRSRKAMAKRNSP